MGDDNSERDPQQEELDIMVVGFVGNLEYQFLRVEQKPEGDIYIENRYKPEGPHYSYHASGEVHRVWFDKGKRVCSLIDQALPISNFRDKYSLGSWVIYAPDLPIWKRLTVDKNRKTEAVIRFDMPRLTGKLSVNFWLVESGRDGLLQELIQTVRNMPLELLGHLVITKTTPWLVLFAATV